MPDGSTCPPTTSTLTLATCPHMTSLHTHLYLVKTRRHTLRYAWGPYSSFTFHVPFVRFAVIFPARHLALPLLLQRLPEHAANALLEQLLLRQSSLVHAPQAPGGAGGGSCAGGRGAAGMTLAAATEAAVAGSHPPSLRPATLELFRHCVSRVALRGPGVVPEWLAALAGFRSVGKSVTVSCVDGWVRA